MMTTFLFPFLRPFTMHSLAFAAGLALELAVVLVLWLLLQTSEKHA
jgi:hypothetical protein